MSSTLIYDTLWIFLLAGSKDGTRNPVFGHTRWHYNVRGLLLERPLMEALSPNLWIRRRGERQCESGWWWMRCKPAEDKHSGVQAVMGQAQAPRWEEETSQGSEGSSHPLSVFTSGVAQVQWDHVEHWRLRETFGSMSSFWSRPWISGKQPYVESNELPDYEMGSSVMPQGTERKDS